MQIKGLSHRLFHATFCSNQQFQAAGIPQPLWAPGPAFGCSPGKIFFILTGLNLQCCKFCLLPIILLILTRLLFPSSLQLPVSSRGHQASPQACSFQLNKLSPLALSPCTVCSSPSHPGACLSESPQVFSASLVLESPEVGPELQQWSHKSCTQGNTCLPPAGWLLLLAQPRMGCSGGFSTSRARSLIQLMSSPIPHAV